MVGSIVDRIKCVFFKPENIQFKLYHSRLIRIGF